MTMPSLKWTQSTPENGAVIVTAESKTYGRATSIMDTQSAFDLRIHGFRVYPGMYRGRVILFCAPRRDIGGLKRNQPKPLHIYLTGKKGTYHRNGNAMDNRLVNLAAPGEPLNSVYPAAEGGPYIAYIAVNGEYTYLGQYPKRDEALQAVDDASNLCREVVLDVLSL